MSIITIPQPVGPRLLTQRAFICRFTDEEAVRLDLASIGATEQAAYLRRYQAKVAASPIINMDDPDIPKGIRALELGGLLADGRAAQIIDAQIQNGEKP